MEGGGAKYDPKHYGYSKAPSLSENLVIISENFLCI